MADLRVDLCCSQRHYHDHAYPIWEKLPDRLKGDAHRIGRGDSPSDPHRIVMVAGWPDVQSFRGRHRMIYVEHGAGQGYYDSDGNPLHWPGYSSSGGSRHHGVIGFISPSEAVASRWSTAPSVAVGCPKMDWRHELRGTAGGRPVDPKSICFAWHFDSGVCPEARSAWPYWKDQMRGIIDDLWQRDWHVYGHAHPKWRGQLDDVMTLLGMEVLMSDQEVFDEAAVLVVDNSSLGCEFMSLDRPVVWLDAPCYRRDHHHGGRFWDWTAGLDSADDATALGMLIERRHDGDRTAAQRAIVDSVYKYTDGTSSQRAADFVTQLVDSL